MISQANSATVRAAYPSKTNETKAQKQTTDVSSQGNTSKTEQLKESIDSGEYKVNIQALSEKIADTLL